MTAQQEAIEHLRTVRDWIRFGVTQLEQSEVAYGQGTDNALDESVFLVLRSLALPVDELDPFLEAKLLPHERKRLYDVFERRCQDRVPAAYILGESWLSGMRFIVNEHVLIPRSPISELIAERFEPWLDNTFAPQKIVDVCTGSGCLAILAALAFEDAEVVATDISTQALDIAAKNVQAFGLGDRVTLFQSDMMEALEQDHSYELILCNPPYVNSQSMANLPPEFRHEPQLALAGGDDGMTLVARLLSQIRTRIHPDGWLVLEIGHERTYFEAAFAHFNPIWLQTSTSGDQIMLIAGRELIT